MKKRLNIYFLIPLLLIGYYCQVTRFKTASQRYRYTHSYEKGLAKQIVACLNLRTNSAKKLLPYKKNINPGSSADSYLSASLLSPERPENYFYSNTNYFQPSLFFSGKRGPPSLI